MPDSEKSVRQFNPHTDSELHPEFHPANSPRTLAPHHREHLRKSAITSEIENERGYWTITNARELEQGDGTPADYQIRVPGIAIPVYRLGVLYTTVLRPDTPRTHQRDGKTRILKYEWPAGLPLCVDVLPRYREMLIDPKIPLWFTEGAKKADALASLGQKFIPANLNGVWGWRRKNADADSIPLPDFDAIALKGRTVVLAFDSDYAVNKQVRLALDSFAAFLGERGASVSILQLPHGEDKMGVDDAIVAGWSYEQLCEAIRPAAPVKHSTQVLLMARDIGMGTLRLNECDDTITTDAGRITDVDFAKLSTALYDRQFSISKERLVDICITEAARNAYHPVREYLDSLVWDGNNHINALGECLHSSDSDIVYPTGDAVPLASVFLMRWLIGAVAKAYEQAQNMMLVLAGPQNLGKSSLVRWLGSPLADYRIEGPITVGDKDAEIRLIRTWIWEVSELDATTRKADVAAIKDFITRQVVTVRKPYGRGDIRKPALASLIGTINNSDGFLTDPTGNRRFMVTTLTRIDWSYTKLDVNQIWAHAVHEYRRGMSWRLDPTELQAQQLINRSHEVTDPLDGWLDRYFIFSPDAGGEGLAMSDIIDHLRNKDVPVNGEKSWVTRIGTALTKRNLYKRQVATNGGRQWRYFGLIRK